MVIGYNIVGYCETKAGPFTLGRVERFENIIQLFTRNTLARIGKYHPDFVVDLLRSYPERSALRHCFQGIGDQVEESLF